MEICLRSVSGDMSNNITGQLDLILLHDPTKGKN